MRIIAFGEIIWDCYEKESCIGGAALNFAAHCAKCGAESYLFSAVGDDALGRQAIGVLEGFGVDCTYVQFSGKETGRCLVQLNADGIPQYNVLADTAYDNITCTAENTASVNGGGFDALYFGTLIQRSPVSRDSLRKLCDECRFPEIVCDVNLRKNCFDADSATLCLEKATVLKISEEEEPALRALHLYETDTDDPQSVCEAICGRYPQIKYLLFTRGENGSFVYCAKERTSVTVPAKPVTVVSTVGAGDSFLAAWTVSYLAGRPPQAATEAAAALSGFVVSQTDAVPDYEKEAFLYE